MNKEINTGGQAFPRTTTHLKTTEIGSSQYDGMTLRDYFAGKAMQGYLASWTEDNNTFDGIEDAHEKLADQCYQLADAMIIARKQK